jgi:hypothetical protein
LVISAKSGRILKRAAGVSGRNVLSAMAGFP